MKDLVEAYERHVIEDALRATQGNQRRAARTLGVLPTTLHEKMKRLGLRAAVFLPGGDAASVVRGPEPSF